MVMERAAHPLPGYPREIAQGLWMMEATRQRTLRLLRGLDQRSVDWEGPDGRENAIGSLLYHLADVEMWWLYEQMLSRAFPPAVQADLPIIDRDDEGRLSRVLGVPLRKHRERLARCRARLLEELRGMRLGEWHRPRPIYHSRTETATPTWIVFHLIHHEAYHTGQMSSLRARAARVLESTR
jgi:uncharacterized damage-inducible protein DinB